MSGRQASSDGPQGTQSSRSRKTSQRVTAEVQLVGFSLHQLQREAEQWRARRHLDVPIKSRTQMNLESISKAKTYLDFFLMA